MPLADPNNCWPFSVDRFADAIVASAAFRTLVMGSAAETAADDQIEQFVFGRKLTHSKSGHTHTREDLAQLGAYAQVYSAPDNPYGKRRTGFNHWEPHGTTIITLGRLVTAQQLAGYAAIPDSMERDWQNIVGTIVDQVITWTRDHDAPHLTSIAITEDGEQEAKRIPTQGFWQFSEITCVWGIGD